MTIRRRVPTVVAAVLLFLLALARGAGALALLGGSEAARGVTDAPAPATTWVGLGLLAVAILALTSGVWLLLGRAGGRAIAVSTLVLFVAGGAVNGLVLFGRPRPQGVALNVGYAAVVLVCIVWGHRRPRVASGA